VHNKEVLGLLLEGQGLGLAGEGPWPCRPRPCRLSLALQVLALTIILVLCFDWMRGRVSTSAEEGPIPPVPLCFNELYMVELGPKDFARYSVGT